MCKFIAAIFLLGLTWISTVSPVLACSGGVSMTLPELVDDAEIIVHGQVELIDDAGQNGVLRVASYLKGQPGPEHILLSLYEPARVTASNERFSSGGCFHGVYPPLQAGDNIVIFLQQKANGAYELAPRHFSNGIYYNFNTIERPTKVYVNPEGMVVNVPSPYDNLTSDMREVTLGEFEDLIQQANGESAQPPLTDEPYPLFAPLLITTQSGAKYLLAVDGSDPQLIDADDPQMVRRDQPGCMTLSCTAFSPNGVDFVTLQNVNGVTNIKLPYGDTLPGEAFLFSSTSDALVAWVTQGSLAQIVVYTLRYQRLRWQDEWAQQWRVFDLDLRDKRFLIGQAAWSPDGRLLAFSDDRGLWLWDVFTPDSEPQLFSESPLEVRAFSSTGRYLLTGEVGFGAIIDLITGEQLPDGALSPDDRILLTYEPEFRVLELTPFSEKTNMLPLGSQVTEAIWKDNNQYIVLTCPDATDRDSCRVAEKAVNPAGGGTYTGYAFDYMPVGNSLAIVQDDYTLVLRNNTLRSLYQYERDLSTTLDTPIVNVEWLSSLLVTE